MTKRKLKGFVMPTVYLLAIATIIVSIMLIGNTIKSYNANNEVDTYVMKTIIENSQPVQNEVSDKVIKPFTKENISVKKEFYDRSSDAEKQQNSLIYYEGTYMQNSGILYGSDEEFEVVATMDGTISNIKEDNLLGFIVEIEHNSKLTTVYQSLKDVKVTVGATIKQGEVLGTSGPNKIDTTSQNELLFEVFHNGALINPNTYYEMDLKALSE